MVSSMLPHKIRVVSHKRTVLHPAGQSEAQMHPDVVVQGAVICGGVGAERAIPVCHLPLYDPAFVHLFGGSWADDIVQPDVPVSSIVRVAGVDNLALVTTKDINDIPAFDRPGLGALPVGFPSFLFPAGHCPPLLWPPGLCWPSGPGSIGEQ